MPGMTGGVREPQNKDAPARGKDLAGEVGTGAWEQYDVKQNTEVKLKKKRVVRVGNVRKPDKSKEVM